MKIAKVLIPALAGVAAVAALVVANEKFDLCEKHCPLNKYSCTLKCPWCKHKNARATAVNKDTREF